MWCSNGSFSDKVVHICVYEMAKYNALMVRLAMKKHVLVSKVVKSVRPLKGSNGAFSDKAVHIYVCIKWHKQMW